MRSNLKEKAKNLKINYSNEMKRIENLFGLSAIIKYYRDNDWTGLYPQYTTIQDFFDKCMFVRYPYAGTFINIQDMRISLGISEEDINNNNVNTLLDYFEFIFNVMCYFIDNYQKYKIEFDGEYIRKICGNIRTVLGKLNYKLEEKDGYCYIVEKDAATTAISEIYEDIADEVIEYRRYNLKGDIKRKSQILNSLANKFEAIRPDLKANNFTEIEDKTGCMLNNLDIRHNNTTGKHENDIVKNMSDEELEQWYDRTYDLLLMCFMFHHYLDFRDEIKDLNKNLKNKV